MIPRPRAFTLIELTVVMAVLSVVAVVATSMLGNSRVIDSMHARQEAELLTSTLRMARSTAVLRAQPIRAETIVESGIVGYRVSDPLGGLAQPQHRFPSSLITHWSAPSVDFEPTGMTNRSLSVNFVGDTSIWQVDVLSASGQVILRQNPR